MPSEVLESHEGIEEEIWSEFFDILPEWIFLHVNNLFSESVDASELAISLSFEIRAFLHDSV